MTFEAQQKSVEDNGSYEGAKIYCLQKLEPEQWRFCDTFTKVVSQQPIRNEYRIICYHENEFKVASNLPISTKRRSGTRTTETDDM